MDKITEALKKLLPESETKEVAAAINEMLQHAKKDLEQEYNEKLEQAYTELTSELSNAEKIAEQGYEEAYAIIGDLRNRLEVQGEEYKAALEEGYEEAYQMLVKERSKNEQLEIDMYEEYDNKLVEMKEYIVDKVDQFLQYKGNEIYEQVRRDVINDPRMAEHKVTLDKIVDLTSNYIANEGVAAISNSKVNDLNKTVEDLKGQLRIMEARQIRLSTENTKLNEAVRQSQQIISENRKSAKRSNLINEQKERSEKASNVTGRGFAQGEAIIAEYAAPEANGDMNQMLILSGLKKS